jgi:branched-chain amino acid transport system substrate-binding protein
MTDLMLKRTKLVLFGLMFFILALGTSFTLAQENVKVGVVAPLTGPAANSGIAMQQGMQLAVQEWNEQGGVTVGDQTLQVEALFEDSQSQPAVGLSAAQKLITRDQVDFLIGEAFHSSVTMAIMELAPQYNIPILSGEPVSIEIANKVAEDPEKYRLFWKGDFNSDAYAEAIYQTVQGLIESGEFTPENKTIAFIVEDTDYGRSNAEYTAQLFAEDGWETVATETVALGHSSFHPQLTKMRGLDPDVLVSVFTAANSGSALVQQFREQRLDALHAGIYYPLRPEFMEEAGSAANGLLWTPLQYAPNLFEEQADFAQRTGDLLNVDATSDTAFGYDIMNVALEAIESAGSLEPEAIATALSETDYDGILGRWVFDQSNHTAKAGREFIPVPVAQIQDGQNVIVWPESATTGTYETQPWLE